MFHSVFSYRVNQISYNAFKPSPNTVRPIGLASILGLSYCELKWCSTDLWLTWECSWALSNAGLSCEDPLIHSPYRMHARMQNCKCREPMRYLNTCRFQSPPAVLEPSPKSTEGWLCMFCLSVFSKIMNIELMQLKGYKLSFLSSGHVMYSMMIAVHDAILHTWKLLRK